MATGGNHSQSVTEEKRQSLKCTLCLEVFTSPKILPCHHSFCLECLKNLISCLGSTSFPCPQCRRRTSVPTGGVAAFQSNFYFHPDDLERARKNKSCLTHDALDLDLYCVDCQTIVCLKCVLTKHKQHDTIDLSEAADSFKDQLKADKVRLQEAVTIMTDEVSADQAELQAVRCKRAVIEAAVDRKHAMLVAMVNKARDEILASLNTLSGEVESQVTLDLGCKRGNLEQLHQLLKRLEKATLTGTDAGEAVIVAKEMREGQGSHLAVSILKSPIRRSIDRPVLKPEITDENCMRTFEGVYGTVHKVTMAITFTEVNVKNQFRCGQEDDIEVFSLSPEGDGSTVYLSFAWRGQTDDVPSEVFDEKGRHIKTLKQASGKRRSWASRSQGKSMYTKPKSGEQSIYKKSTEGAIFRLNSNLAGKADVFRVEVVLENPFKTVSTKEFSIEMGAFRAFDVNTSKEWFVVLEDNKDRDVFLYRRGQPIFEDIYSPPTSMCRPSDVCFYLLGGQEVLLIADEGTDSIHVVSISKKDLTGKGIITGLLFERYLSPGCPLLVQPTSLNTDTKGRLWVACRGGNILTITNIADID